MAMVMFLVDIRLTKSCITAVKGYIKLYFKNILSLFISCTDWALHFSCCRCVYLYGIPYDTEFTDFCASGV